MTRLSSYEKDEFTPQLDLEYPPEEVLLIFRDGETRRLIPDEHEELLTEPRQRDKHEEQPNDIHENTEEELTMDSFDQIKLERQKKEEIRGYDDNLTQEKLDRYDGIKAEFGAQSPADIDIWLTVWDEYNRDYDTGIPESILWKPTMQAMGMRKENAKEAVDIGKEFALLVEDEPVESLPSSIDDDSNIVRPVLPEVRPDLYVDNAADFADRNIWKTIWESEIFDKSDTLPEETLRSLIKPEFGCENDTEANALIAVGEMCGAIVKQEDGYALSERPDDFWIQVWEVGGAGDEPGEPLSRRLVIAGIKLTAEISEKEAIERFETAVANHEIYSPPNIPSNEYLINDPSDDDSPPILDGDNGPSDDSGGGSLSGGIGKSNTHDENGTTSENGEPHTTSESETTDTTDGTNEPVTQEASDETSETDRTDTNAPSDVTVDTNTTNTTSENRDEHEDGGVDRSSTTSSTTPTVQSNTTSDNDSTGTTSENRHEDEDSGVDTSSTSDSTTPTVQNNTTSENSTTSTQDETTDTKADSPTPTVDNESRPEQSSNESGETSDDRESTGSTDDQRADDDGEDDVAYDVEGGISMADIDSDVFDGDPNRDPDAADSTDETTEQGHNKTDGSARFQTYEEPDLNEDEYDVDTESLSQFISHHATVGEPDQKQMKTPCSTFIDVFDEWAKINNLELDKLSPDRANNMRKGSFKSMLAEHHNIEKAEVRFGDKRTYGFRPIELSDTIQNIIS